MSNIKTHTNVIDGMIHISTFDKSRIWFNSTTDQGSCRVFLTKAQALELIENLRLVADRVE